MKKGSMTLRLFLYASLFSLVWLGAYVGISGVMSVKDSGDGGLRATPTIVADIPQPESSYWSVLAVVNEEHKVSRLYLRYADFLEDVLVFVEVPVDTKVELPAGGYEVLSVYHPEIPELFMVSEFCDIFSEDTLCMALAEAFSGMLGTRPKACYITENSVFEMLTEQTKEGVRFIKPKSVKETIMLVTSRSLSDRETEEELVYTESYADVKQVLYHRLPGEDRAQEYVPDSEGIGKMTDRYRKGIFTEE